VDDIGHVPLPPYIKRDDDLADRDRYQTIYARARGSIAAPTAGLHFTPQLLSTLDARGIERAFVTLHVGYGTFQPVRVEDVEQHAIAPEEYEVTPETASTLSRARAERRRIVAVGTTTVRTLESLTIREGVVEAGRGSTNLFVHPGHQFQLVAGLVTNFHLPRSSLLMLVSALAGQERVRAAYRHAIAEHYRFYSYGDAMAIV
jgi:S-adenosylmethionine:tRNA ribosyltransferase-isomerase